MTDTSNTPIVVDPNPLPDQVLVAVRALLQIVGTALVTRGLASSGEVEAVIGALLVIGPFVWAQIRARRNTEKLTVLAQAAPDRIAVLK